MNTRRLLFTAAAFTGWCGVALYDSASQPTAFSTGPADSDPPAALDTAAALHAMHGSGRSSRELSRLAQLIGHLSAQVAESERSRIESWPPSALRFLAIALLNADNTPPAAIDSDPPEEPSNPIRDLADCMENGREIEIPVTSIRLNYGEPTLRDWVKNDPASATAAIMKLPPAERSADIDIAAETMAKFDPAGAMEFVLKSGEQHLAVGAAEAFGYAVIKNPSLTAARQYFERMTPGQQNSLLQAMTMVVPDYQYNPQYSEFDDSNINSKDPLHRSDLGLIACAVLQSSHPGPGLDTFLQNLAEFPRAVDEVRRYLESSPSLTSVQQAALATLDAALVKTAVTTGGLDALFTAGPAVFDRAAPAVIANLARGPDLPEALTLLDKIRDPDSRLTTLEAILPYWMDTDPAAARAAFDAAPLTALERERWERHPAFLLHPAP